MSFNVAQIRDRAREILGKDISDQEAVMVMNETSGGDEGQVYQYLRSMKDTGSGSSGGIPPFTFD